MNKSQPFQIHFSWQINAFMDNTQELIHTISPGLSITVPCCSSTSHFVCQSDPESQNSEVSEKCEWAPRRLLNPPSLTELRIILFNENCRHLKMNAKCLSIFYNLRLFLSAQSPAHLAETSVLEQDRSLPSASTCSSAPESQRAQQPGSN